MYLSYGIVFCVSRSMNVLFHGRPEPIPWAFHFHSICGLSSAHIFRCVLSCTLYIPCTSCLCASLNECVASRVIPWHSFRYNFGAILLPPPHLFQVMCFSALPVLATLLLNHNRIADVDDMGPPAFASLEAIALSGNCIERWGAVDRLNGLPALRSLRFSGNPVTSGLGASEVRLHEFFLKNYGNAALFWCL